MADQLFASLLQLLPELNKAFIETLYMMAIGLGSALIFGIPIGLLLFVTDQGLLFKNRVINGVIGTFVNIIRSIPFIILLVALLPLTKLLVGTTIGPTAASVSLSVAAVPFFARLVESALREIDKGVIEAALAVGASPWLIIREVLLPEALPGIVNGITITTISLLGFSAMAGIVGGGGVGDLAIRFGYYRFENDIMIITVVILICMVQLIQFIGDRVSRSLDKR